MKTQNMIVVVAMFLAMSLAMSLVSLLSGCSDSSDTKATESAASQPSADTSYLDELAAKQGIALDDDANGEQSAEMNPEMGEAIVDDAGDPGMTDEEQREWVKERESKSLLGKSRDKGKKLRDQIQGSTAPGEGIAVTLSDEEYAASSGLRWEMPEDWLMAIPPTGQFAEMYIKNPLGNASVSFIKETRSVRDLVRSMQGQIIDPMGGRSKATTADKTVAGYSVQIVDLAGTYLDPGSKGSTREQIFYAIHAVIFDLGDSRIVIKMWGPEDTVKRSVPAFDAMIEQTAKK